MSLLCTTHNANGIMAYKHNKFPWQESFTQDGRAEAIGYKKGLRLRTCTELVAGQSQSI